MHLKWWDFQRMVNLCGMHTWTVVVYHIRRYIVHDMCANGKGKMRNAQKTTMDKMLMGAEHSAKYPLPIFLYSALMPVFVHMKLYCCVWAKCIGGSAIHKMCPKWL